MKEQQIDLMPEDIRERSQAGIRAGQYVAGYAIVAAVVILLTTHARLELSAAQSNLQSARQQAELVLKTERKASKLRGMMSELKDRVAQYKSISYPVQTSSVVATIVNVLPESVSLDRLDLEAGTHRSGRSPRSKGPSDDDKKNKMPQRWLTSELAGFAASDAEIAELVGRLQKLQGFEDVSLDFSRTRSVRGQSARAFRLSFRIDLNAKYEVVQYDTGQPKDGKES